jgi:hypothetical protein
LTVARLPCLFVLALVTALATIGSAAGSAHVSLLAIGRPYAIVTHIKPPFADVIVGTLYIEKFDRSTGAISGYGVADTTAYTMTGSAHGRTIMMRVSAAGAVAVDHGTIADNGSISGTLTQPGLGASGMWKMTPMATSVDVVKSGFTVTQLGHQTTQVSWGVALQNRSRSYDALKLDLIAEAVGPNGRVITDDLLGGLDPAPAVPVVPASTTVYYGGTGSFTGVAHIHGLRILVGIGSAPRKRYGLPPVSSVTVEQSSEEITGTVTNPYSTTMSPYDYSASVVVYDEAGNIIGGDDCGQIGDVSNPVPIKPGGQAPVTCAVLDVPFARIASAHITVAPA